MNELIESVERRQARKLPSFREGDRVRVHFQVIEGQRKRTQVFEGVVLKLQGPGVRRTFVVRKMSFGVGVERTFPLHSPKVEQVEVVARGEVRRAKLYYLRGRIGRRARVRERTDLTPEEQAELGLADPAEQLTDEAETAETAEDAPETEAAEQSTGDEQPDGEESAEAPPEAAQPPTEEPEAEQPEEPEAEQPEEQPEASEPEQPQPDGGEEADADAAAEADSASDEAKA
jgi:large subunit ribosomal protein L19